MASKCDWCGINGNYPADVCGVIWSCKRHQPQARSRADIKAKELRELWTLQIASKEAAQYNEKLREVRYEVVVKEMMIVEIGLEVQELRDQLKAKDELIEAQKQELFEIYRRIALDVKTKQ